MTYQEASWRVSSCGGAGQIGVRWFHRKLRVDSGGHHFNSIASVNSIYPIMHSLSSLFDAQTKTLVICHRKSVERHWIKFIDLNTSSNLLFIGHNYMELQSSD